MNKRWKHLVCWRYTMLTTDEPRQYLQKYNEECWSSVLTTEVSVRRPIFAKHLWKNFKPGVVNHPDTWDMIKRPSPNHLVKWTGYYTHVQYMMFSSQPGTSNAGSTSWIPPEMWTFCASNSDLALPSWQIPWFSKNKWLMPQQTKRILKLDPYSSFHTRTQKLPIASNSKTNAHSTGLLRCFLTPFNSLPLQILGDKFVHLQP